MYIILYVFYAHLFVIDFFFEYMSPRIALISELLVHLQDLSVLYLEKNRPFFVCKQENYDRWRNINIADRVY